jgi:hypothetical protein
MEKIYFNHSLLIDSSDSLVVNLLVEIVELKNSLGSVPLYVYQGFWNLGIQSGTLLSFLAKRDNQDGAKVIILSLMHNGPYFHDSSTIQYLIITPGVPKSCFARDLMNICYHDNQQQVLSLADEKVLTSPKYTISAGSQSIDIINLIGREKLLHYLERRLVFKNIDTVFQEIIQSHPTIEILLPARKSAMKHNFKGMFYEVYKAITALESEMVLLIDETPDQQRIDAFCQKTGFEISRESPELLRNPKYRKHREFTPGTKGKTLFDWHIKIGRETRIHYFIDKEEKKIYIYHCGKHLPVPSYQS